MCKILSKSKLWKEWKKNWPSLTLQFLIFIIIGGSIGWWITNSLKPQTYISVECKIKEGINANYSLEVSFYNNADFAGKNFYIYLWKVTSSGWGSDYSVSEHCERIQELDVDFKNRFKIFCDFIPPKSKFGFSIDSDLDKDILTTKKIKIEWWGETTRYEEKFVLCE